MGFMGRMIKRGATDDDDDDDDLDLEDEVEPVDSESDADASKGGLLGRLRGLRKGKASNDDDDDDEDWDPENLREEKNNVSDDGSGHKPDADLAEEDPPNVQVVRLDGVPDVRVVGDSSGGSTPSGPQPGNAPP